MKRDNQKKSVKNISAWNLDEEICSCIENDTGRAMPYRKWRDETIQGETKQDETSATVIEGHIMDT